ncbi:MAG: hypothetical protein WCJ56_05745 [bacterium]
MKRTLLTGLGILIFNIAIVCSASYAAYSCFIRNDYVIAALFALLAAAGIILQPWILILLALNSIVIRMLSFDILLQYGVIISLISLISYPIYVTITSTWFYSFIEKRERMPALLLRFWTMPLGKKLKNVAICVVVLVGIAYSRQIDFPAFNRQPPPNLPKNEALNSIKDNRTYCVDNFMESEWLWRARATQQQMDALYTQYHLRPLTADESRTEFISYQLTDLAKPYWWQPVVTSQTKQYRGDLETGNSISVIWDSQSQVMYARSHYRFFIGD